MKLEDELKQKEFEYKQEYDKILFEQQREFEGKMKKLER